MFSLKYHNPRLSGLLRRSPKAVAKVGTFSGYASASAKFGRNIGYRAGYQSGFFFRGRPTDPGAPPARQAIGTAAGTARQANSEPGKSCGCGEVRQNDYYIRICNRKKSLTANPANQNLT